MHMTQRRLSEQSASELLPAKRRPSNASEELPQEIGDNLMRATFTHQHSAHQAQFDLGQQRLTGSRVDLFSLLCSQLCNIARRFLAPP